MKKHILLIATIFTFAIFFQSCDWFTQEDLEYALGWNQSDENTANIEDDITLGSNFSSENLPSSVDLSPYFPPIGDQGQYGTCVAWATAYNHKSFLEAYSRGETNYTDESKMMSPKDLFWAIDNSLKGEDCNGTNFESAYDVILNRGVALLTTVPYTGLGDCSSSPQSGWTTDAENHKIANYREIERDVNTIKSYLANNRAVVFGAKLGDQFMDYTGGVLDYQDFNYTGQHAYHAMILCGYDDNQGANGAFRVVNSWGTSWGDNGYCWVDYNYFVTDNFCFTAFVASDTEADPDGDGNNQVDDPTSGYDLIAWELNDEDDPSETDQTWRISHYNVYNSGTSTLNASDDWSIVYLLYNAYDGEDYQILLFDYYSDDYGYQGGNDSITDQSLKNQFPAQGWWWNWVDVVSGQSVSNAVFGNDNPFSWGYKIPSNVNGYYYLVIFADAFDTYQESDESNNYTYYTADNGEPLYIVNGVIQNAPAKKKGFKTGVPVKNQDADLESIVNTGNKNAYTPQEINIMIQNDIRSGEMKNKIMDFSKSNRSKSKKISK